MMDVRLLFSSFLIVVGTVSWRPDTYFAGAFDVVVVSKAILACVALVLAILARPHQQRSRVWAPAIWFLLTYVSISVIGAWASGDLRASGIVALRLLITSGVVLALARAYPPRLVLESFAASMVAIGVTSAVTGLVLNGLVSGRLHGGIPPLTPNEIALLCSVGLLTVTWRCFQSSASMLEIASVPLIVGVIWLTGSRTGLVVLVGAVLVMLIQARRPPVAVISFVVAFVPVLFYVVAFTSAIEGFLGRGGWQSISTLSARTIAWRAAVDLPDTWWERWFGGGLALKRIAVPARWWGEQGLDSSPVSALVQTGIVGVVLLTFWVIIAGVRALSTSSPERALWTGMLAFVVIRSLLESGLFDATPSFLIFFLIALLAPQSTTDSTRDPRKSGEDPSVRAFLRYRSGSHPPFSEPLKR